MRITINGEEFKSKKDATNRARDILHSYKNIARLKPEEEDFICGLLSNHPEHGWLAGEDIQIWTQRNDYNGLHFCAVKPGHYAIVFSYRACLSKSNKKTSVILAMRKCIEEQTMDYREWYFGGCEHAICEISGEIISRNQSHVHHSDPSFSDLLKGFCLQEGINIESIKIKKGERGGRIIDDIELALKWQKYHRRNAKLQVVSIEVHQGLHYENHV